MQNLTPMSQTPTPMSPKALRDMDRVMNRAQTLLSLIELQAPLPELTIAAAALHESMAGPGPIELDYRPGSLEVVNNPELHAAALAQAKAREQGRTSVIAHLPTSTLEAAADFDARTLAHRDAVAEAYQQGHADRVVQEGIWWTSATLWEVLRRWFQGQKR
jgi:hypothetical protein